MTLAIRSSSVKDHPFHFISGRLELMFFILLIHCFIDIFSDFCSDLQIIFLVSQGAIS
jgi:hypothetical protein